MTEPTKTEAWERQPGETDKQWRAFKVFRDMGEDRTIKKTAEKLGTHISLMDRWSAKNAWLARARGFDDWADQQLKREMQRGINRMAHRHATVAQSLLGKAIQKLQGLNGETMTTQEMLQTVRLAVDVERLSRGEATERSDAGPGIGVVAVVPAQAASVDEWLKQAEAYKKAKQDETAERDDD